MIQSIVGVYKPWNEILPLQIVDASARGSFDNNHKVLQ